MKVKFTKWKCENVEYFFLEQWIMQEYCGLFHSNLFIDVFHLLELYTLCVLIFVESIYL